MRWMIVQFKRRLEPGSLVNLETDTQAGCPGAEEEEERTSLYCLVRRQMEIGERVGRCEEGSTREEKATDMVWMGRTEKEKMMESGLGLAVHVRVHAKPSVGKKWWWLWWSGVTAAALVKGPLPRLEP